MVIFTVCLLIMNSNNFQQHLTLAVVGGVVVMALMEMKGQHSRLWHHARYTGPLHIELVLIGIGAVFKIEHWFFANA